MKHLKMEPVTNAVDVVESMRRIALQEMNRKDREIDGLNEQLEVERYQDDDDIDGDGTDDS
uniref:Uncharacterized protein n=1 Tax=Solanum lycopersicum TaxID=4081 RepID=A0A3Q7FU26_SOLLC